MTIARVGTLCTLANLDSKETLTRDRGSIFQIPNTTYAATLIRQSRNQKHWQAVLDIGFHRSSEVGILSTSWSSRNVERLDANGNRGIAKTDRKNTPLLPGYSCTLSDGVAFRDQKQFATVKSDLKWWNGRVRHYWKYCCNGNQSGRRQSNMAKEQKEEREQTSTDLYHSRKR